MAATPSIKITKSMAARGGTQLWSNTYHFNGGTPADNTHWTTFADAVVNAEKAALAPDVTIVRADGYAAGGTVAIFSKSYSTVGTASVSGASGTPIDVAALVRWSTTARTSKNHPIYLFSYFHGCRIDGSDRDKLLAAQKTALETYATAWISGFSDGTNTLVRAGPNGATGTSRLVNQYLTHRDFPR